MAEWWIEHGIGETRAALIEGDAILEARIVPDDDLVAGSVVTARLVARMPERGQGVVAWDDLEALVAPLPAGVSQGALCTVEIVRPAIGEPGKPKRALARPCPSTVRAGLVEARAQNTHPSATLRTGFDWLSASGELGMSENLLRHTDPDRFEAAGWSELIEQATTRAVGFPGGALSLHPTPAMMLIDIDGTLAPGALSVTGAQAAARAVRRLDITGAIGIDLPGTDKAARHAAAEAIDAALPQPFERTAVNGFGFVQIVRPRRRRSLVEVFAMEPARAHARALLRRAERSTGAGERTIAAHPAVVAEIERRADWLAELSRRTGTAIALRADPALAISAGHVQARFA